MGLVTIMEQVEMLGGEIQFDSSLGRGTKVQLNLPIQ
jgi:signal transduction histidine kinase